VGVVVALHLDPPDIRGRAFLNAPAHHEGRVAVPVRLVELVERLDAGPQVSVVAVERSHSRRGRVEGAGVEHGVLVIIAADPEAAEQSSLFRLIELLDLLGRETAVPLHHEVAHPVAGTLIDRNLEPRFPRFGVDDQGVPHNLEVEITLRAIQLGQAGEQILLERALLV